MSKNRMPRILRQKRKNGNDFAFVKLNGKHVYLGTWGNHDVQEQYNRVISEWLARGKQLPPPPDTVAIMECIEIYLVYARQYYQQSKSSLERVNYSMNALLALYGRMPAAEFTATHLRAVRETLVHSKIAIVSINERIRHIVKMFRYCASLDLISATPYEKCNTLEPLRPGRCMAKHSKVVEPVSRGDVAKTLLHLNRSTAAMVQLLLLTGARAGELIGLCRNDINTTSDCWTARLEQHKTAHRGKLRTIVFGPEAQRILKPFFLLRKPEEPLFSPQDHWHDQHERATTPRRPEQKPTVRKTDREVGNVYDVPGLRKAIERACVKAGVPTWTPHQLRHTRATELREKFGIEAAAAVLGHSTIKTTEIYAKVNESATIKVMAEIG